jgi:SAM-dependent methyltransferase
MDLSIRRIINSIDYRLVRPLTGRDAKNWSSKTDFHKTYRRLVKTLKASHSRDEAMKLAVGGDFEAVGMIELEALKFHGLKKDDYLIDVGCGSGRLAKPLAEYLEGKYLGIDVVPDLIVYARELVQQPDWRFELAKGLIIPEEDSQADMVCFFSVLTHLLHEESFVYLREAKRVLKPGGKIVLSFLDFRVPGHWDVFEFNLHDICVASHPLNVFMCEDAIRVWARHLDLEVEIVKDGNEIYVPLPQPVKLEDGTVLKDLAAMGQSICVLVRK